MSRINPGNIGTTFSSCADVNSGTYDFLCGSTAISKVQLSNFSLNDDDLKEFVELQKTYASSEKSWTISVENADQNTFDLSVKNPNKEDDAPLREPMEILEEIAALDTESAEILNGIREMLL